MVTTNVQDLGLTATASAPAGCCSSQPKESAAVAAVPAGAITESFNVDGMTCASCVARVSKEVGKVAGAQSVSIDLVSGGVSTMTVASTAPLDRAAVAAAVATTGYKLV